MIMASGRGRGYSARRARWARLVGAACVATFVATFVAGCDGTGVASPDRPIIARTGNAPATLSLVGTWRRAVFFLDDFGIARSSETSWRFDANGSVTRVLVSRNLTFGIADALVSVGSYRVENTRLIVDFITPTPSQLSFEVRRTGTNLEIAGETYLPVAG